MEPEEFTALVWAVLGIHATQDKVDTIVLAAQVLAAAQRQATAPEAAAATQEEAR